MVREWADRLAVVVPAAAFAIVVWAVGAGFASRLGYPFDLEWMEGGQLAHAWRLDRGLPLFVPPSADWAPFVYVPGYPAVLAAIGEVVGLSMPLGRAVSVAGTLAAAGAAAWFVRRETRSWWFGALAAGTFLGTWRDGGAFFDLVRADGLFLGLLAWSITLAFDGRRGTPVAAGLLLAAAALTKQTALVFLLPIGWAVAVRAGLAAVVPALASALVPVAVMAVRWELVSDGAFLDYVVRVPASHPLFWDRAWPGLPRDVGAALPVAAVAAAAGLVVPLLRSGAAPAWLASFGPVFCGMTVAWWGTSVRAGATVLPVASGFTFLAAGTAAAALVVWLGAWLRSGPRVVRADAVAFVVLGLVTFAVTAALRVHNGGYLNVLLPALWFLAVAFATSLGWAWTGARGPGQRLVVAFVATAQLTWGASRTFDAGLGPTDSDRAAGERFVEAAREAAGPVLSPYAAWIPTYAGHPPSVHLMGLWDLDYEGVPFPEHRRVMTDAIRDRHWALVFGSSAKFRYPLGEGYEATGVIAEDGALKPKSGWRASPDRVFVPR
jgi:hypothetical protein